LDKALLVAKHGRARLLYLHHRGEPFLHPELNEIIRRVRAAGFGASFSTNLSLATPAKIEGVLCAGLNEMQIHLSGGATVLELNELLQRLEILRKANLRLRNNACHIGVNYALVGESQDEVMARLAKSVYYDETMPIEFYIPHDWLGMEGCPDRGVDYHACDWFLERCCAVLSTGEIVICCLDQFRYSSKMNVMDIDFVGDSCVDRREICRGCTQDLRNMDWLRKEALALKS